MTGGDRAKRLALCLNALSPARPFHDRIKNDPIEFPHRYQDPKEIEIAGLIASVLAYGRIDLFKRTTEKILALAKGHLYHYFLTFQANKERSRFRSIYYRFNRPQDLFSLSELIHQVVRKHGSIGALFRELYRQEEDDIGPTLSRFVGSLLGHTLAPISPGLRQLLPSPASGSACKRLNLFLRWMIRPSDGVDFGLWKEISPSKLIIPLDTHIVRISRYLKLTARKSPGWKMAKEITGVLRQCDPDDPLKYDFSLCHLGISGDCPLSLNPEKCRNCPLQSECSRKKSVERFISSQV